MALFDTAEQRINEAGRAMSLLTTARSGYNQFAQLRDLLAEYRSGSNAILTATTNQIYPADDRAARAAMIDEATAFIAGLHTRYPEIFPQ